MTDKAKQQQLIAAIQAEPDGYDPLIPVAQSAMETGWFEKVIGWNNFWGLQYPRSQWRRDMIDRPAVKVPTTEFITLARAKANPAWLARWVNYHLEDIFEISFQDKHKRFKFRVYKKFCDWSTEHKAWRYYKAHIKGLWPEAYANRHDAANYFPGLFNDNYRFCTENPEKYTKDCLSIHAELKAAL